VRAGGDLISVSLDTYLDRRTAYTFGVTAAGARTDWYHPRDNEYARDWSFDPVWEARVERDSLGWTAEMRIPYSQLRFVEKERRCGGSTCEPLDPAEGGRLLDPGAAQRDRLVVALRRADRDHGIRPPRRVELMPYVAAGASFSRRPRPGDPFTTAREGRRAPARDLQAWAGPNLTLDATVNPDFGQVEADPAEVNLSAFETFFSEKRPFFTEGSQLLRGGGPSYFYSRRIGQRRTGRPRRLRDCPPAAPSWARPSSPAASRRALRRRAGAVTDAEKRAHFVTDSNAFGTVPGGAAHGVRRGAAAAGAGASKSTAGLHR
jgi:hypothetical protein